MEHIKVQLLTPILHVQQAQPDQAVQLIQPQVTSVHHVAPVICYQAAVVLSVAPEHIRAREQQVVRPAQQILIQLRPEQAVVRQ